MGRVSGTKNQGRMMGHAISRASQIASGAALVHAVGPLHYAAAIGDHGDAERHGLLQIVAPHLCLLPVVASAEPILNLRAEA